MKLELLQMAWNFLDIISGFFRGSLWERKKKGDPIPCGTVGTIKDVSSTGFLGQRIYYMKHAVVSDVQLWMIQYKACG
jgi:hypothetical protein